MDTVRVYTCCVGEFRCLPCQPFVRQIERGHQSYLESLGKLAVNDIKTKVRKISSCFLAGLTTSRVRVTHASQVGQCVCRNCVINHMTEVRSTMFSC